MYVAMLLTDWYAYMHVFTIEPPSKSRRRNVVSKQPQPGDDDPDSDVYIGRSEVAMWMRVVSSWVCILLYMWSLLAPVLMPDR